MRMEKKLVVIRSLNIISTFNPAQFRTKSVLNPRQIKEFYSRRILEAVSIKCQEDKETSSVQYV